MFENISMFDLLPQEESEKFRPIKSNDWKWTFADYPKEKNGLKVFSCFACGGGSTMGYKLAGCDVIGCCEIDSKMNEVYVKNHQPKYNYLMDIRDFNAIPDEELPEELFNLDILDGSPPCTTFSVVGNREETWGKKKKFREGQKEQTLDDLAFVFIDTVRKLKPRVVIMENVEGLLIGDAFEYVRKIYREMDDAGYYLNHWLLKGETMGVPQTRHRVFFVGIRKELKINPEIIDMDFNYKEIPYGQIKSGTGVELNHDTEVYKWLKRAKPCDKRLSDTVKRLGEKEKLFSYKLCWVDRVVQTIAANDRGVGLLRGYEKTCISKYDAVHIQTFPEDYDFINDNLTNIIYICGMSVPPIMMKRIVQRLIEEGVFNYKTDEQKTG
jgi:DNA (cytosine-5)-methyltransferase 1